MARDIEKPLLRELAKKQRRFADAETEANIAKERLDSANVRLFKAREERDSVGVAILNLRGMRTTALPPDAPILDEAVKFVEGEAPVA